MAENIDDDDDTENQKPDRSFGRAFAKTLQSPTAIAAAVALLFAIAHANTVALPFNEQQVTAVLTGIGEYGALLFIAARRFWLRWKSGK